MEAGEVNHASSRRVGRSRRLAFDGLGDGGGGADGGRYGRARWASGRPAHAPCTHEIQTKYLIINFTFSYQSVFFLSMLFVLFSVD